MDVEALYQEIILDHYKHPVGKGLRAPYEAEVHHVNPTCGDEIDLRVHLGVNDVGEPFIEDVSYDGQGCSISQASASVLYELLAGKSETEALAIESAFHQMVSSRGQVEPDEEILGDAAAFAGVAKYPARVKCALLAWMAFKDALVQAHQAEGAGGQSATEVEQGSSSHDQ
jgi:nitrogen fixation protein NifU and related proteins